MSFRGIGPRVHTEYVFVLALLHYGSAQFALLPEIRPVWDVNNNLSIGFSLNKFAGSQ